MAKVKTCECCGAFIFDKPLFSGQVKNDILEHVRKRPGLSGPQIADVIYANRIDGGPETRHIVSVHIAQMRPKLREHGLNIVGTGGCSSTYSLVRLKEANAPSK